ncbi:hypothetical protein Tco_1505101 [Tanacetum coccineum]
MDVTYRLIDLRRRGRRPRKEVVVEPDNYDNPFDINDEPSDDDFVDMGGNGLNASGEMLGLKNEGIDVLEGRRNKNDEMDADMNFKLNFIVLFSSLMGNIKQKGVCDRKILDYIIPNTNLLDINWCEYVWRSLKTCKSRWKRARGIVASVTIDISYSKLLSEKEVEELNSGGFGHEEIEEAFFVEERDLNGCVWMLNKYVNNITNERIGFERILAATENMFPENINLNGFVEKYIDTLKYLSYENTSGTNADMHKTQEREQDVEGEVVASEIGVNEQTYGSGKDLMGPTTNSLAAVVVDTSSLFGFEGQKTWLGC